MRSSSSPRRVDHWRWLVQRAQVGASASATGWSAGTVGLGPAAGPSGRRAELATEQVVVAAAEERRCAARRRARARRWGRRPRAARRAGRATSAGGVDQRARLGPVGDAGVVEGVLEERAATCAVGTRIAMSPRRRRAVGAVLSPTGQRSADGPRGWRRRRRRPRPLAHGRRSARRRAGRRRAARRPGAGRRAARCAASALVRGLRRCRRPDRSARRTRALTQSMTPGDRAEVAGEVRAAGAATRRRASQEQARCRRGGSGRSTASGRRRRTAGPGRRPSSVVPRPVAAASGSARPAMRTASSIWIGSVSWNSSSSRCGVARAQRGARPAGSRARAGRGPARAGRGTRACPAAPGSRRPRG